MAETQRIADYYGRLSQKSAVDPIAAIRRWLSDFDANLPEALHALHARGLRRITTVGGKVVNSEQAPIWTALIAEAWRLLDETKASSGGVPMGFLVNIGAANEAQGRVSAMNCPDQRAHTPSDSEALEEVASAWSDNEWEQWLQVGFEAIERNDSDSYLAFPPLRLYPVGNLIEQLADVFSKGNNINSPLRERMVSAASNALMSRKPTLARDDVRLWQFYHYLAVRDPNVSVARAYLSVASNKSSLSPRILKEICLTAWECSASPPSRADFFDGLLSITQHSDLTSAWQIASRLEEAADERCEQQDLAETCRIILDEHQRLTSALADDLTLIIKEHWNRSSVETALGQTFDDAQSLWNAVRACSLRTIDAHPIWEPPAPFDANRIGIRALEDMEA